MKLSQFRRIIKEEVKKVLKEAADFDISVWGLDKQYQNSKWGSGTAESNMKYSEFLNYVKTGQLAKMLQPTSKTASFGFSFKGPLIPIVQRDLLALGYKHIDGSTEVKNLTNRGGDLSIAINPNDKTMKLYK